MSLLNSQVHRCGYVVRTHDFCWESGLSPFAESKLVFAGLGELGPAPS